MEIYSGLILTYFYYYFPFSFFFTVFLPWTEVFVPFRVPLRNTSGPQKDPLLLVHDENASVEVLLVEGEEILIKMGGTSWVLECKIPMVMGGVNR